jgi:hypothetical protein
MDRKIQRLMGGPKPEAHGQSLNTGFILSCFVLIGHATKCCPQGMASIKSLKVARVRLKSTSSSPSSRSLKDARHWWLMFLILATWKAEIRRMVMQSQSQANSSPDPTLGKKKKKT